MTKILYCCWLLRASLHTHFNNVKKSRACAVYSMCAAFRINDDSMLLQTSAKRPTPFSNTGLNSQPIPKSDFTVRLDWLQLRLIYTSVDQLQPLCDRISSLFDDVVNLDFELPGFNGRRFDFTGRSVRGTRLYCDLPTDTAPGVCLIVLTGRVLKLASMESLYDFCRWLVDDYAAIANRLDIALDDMAKGLSMADVRSAAEADNFAHVHSVEFHRRRVSRGAPWGESVIFGSPQSDKRVIFYDKEIESNGEISAIRMETRLRRHKADFVLHHFCSLTFDEISSYFVDVVTGCVDFLDRTTGEKNLERLQRLGFWSVFLSRVYSHPVKVPSKRREISYQKSLDWLEHCVMPTICIFREVLTVPRFLDKFNAMISDTKRKLLPHHHRIIQVFKSDLLATA